MSTIPVENCRSDLERHGFTTCAWCNSLVHQADCVVAVYYTDHWQNQEHFCTQECKQSWYINHLNKAGL